MRSLLLLVSMASTLPAQEPMLKPTYTQELDASLHFQFSDSRADYIQRLIKAYPIVDLVKNAKSDLEKVQSVSQWVHGRWKHDGNNTPKKSDAISILDEAATGKRFRCVEFSIVLKAALTALDIPTRTVGLKTADMETRVSGAGHVVTEAYLRDLGKWILVDGQWDVIPVLNGKPLNAVELQVALEGPRGNLQVISFSETKADKYFAWISPYLYYFDTFLDQRYDVRRTGKVLMLVPVGAKKPMVFQRIVPMMNLQYTNSSLAFYPKP